MSICTNNDAHWLEHSADSAIISKSRKQARIMAALGLTAARLPKVDADSLLRYYQYLSVNLSLPFFAHYPHPTNAREQSEFCCEVLELLDPSRHIGDEFDGIFCVTRKGRYELKLPLIELEVPQDNLNCRLIEDYWYWFWNWR
jgi:hypothetical protein